MAEQPAWTVNKRHGYVSECTFEPLVEDGAECGVVLQHFQSRLNQVSPSGEVVRFVPGSPQPYEHPECHVFTDEKAMLEWLRNAYDNAVCQSRHYLGQLAKHDSLSEVVDNLVWPNNFVTLSSSPLERQHAGRPYWWRYVFKYTADQIHAKRVVKQVMFDLTAKTGLSPRSFSSILVYCEHQPYAQLLNVWAQLDGRQLRDLYERKCPQETEVRELMNVSLQKLGIDFCRLRIYRKPTYVFDLDELCTMDSPSFLADIQQRISATLKKSLSSGTRDYRPSARKTCGYLVPREHAHSVRQHGVIPVSYAKRGHKTCFGLEAPFELCVFVRPDRKLWMSTWLPAGTVRTMALDELCSEQLGGLLDSVLTEK